MSGNVRSGHLLGYYTKKRHFRLFVFWRNRNPYIPWPVEFQYRRVHGPKPLDYTSFTFPRRRKRVHTSS